MNKTALGFGLWVGLAQVASPQTLESRVNAARGTVAFEYATRPSVCGDGYSITVSDDSLPGWTTRPRRSGTHMGTRMGTRIGRGDSRDECETGPARVVLRRDGSVVDLLRVTVGGRVESVDSDLGEVPAADASRYLLALAPKLQGQSADHAVMGSAIAASGVDWERMLRIARDMSASEAAQKASIFWVSQEATTAATRGLEEVVTDDDIASAVRSDALFYVAQRRNGEGIPALIRVVETSRSMKLRKDAIFYLAQSRDARALNLFEKLLAGR